MPQQDAHYGLDEILARTNAAGLEALRAATDIERRIQQVTTAAVTRRQRRTRVFRRCVWPSS
ncbi:hypothetical protein TH66_19445 [Carbonactinospora thermoautotrophica]|uniref:Uncharacterized protein n=1 Tax=Carbonactinospora thermoautotrophica TaxID=1469144 RepID=A0A132MHW1_9ACTN|nr:hypothetical protein [Carbonactinospora thermoautotrophica]KWW97225.1 hypothetical protein LI90_4450 [Carbonactinospora thermoautotrophica]KWW97424.1 hypothetical protein TH66_17320 [Carbonactinospora thermoautotrophica]KWW97692.1 hypothetical protein TH66_19445 [Carbonactinospora thermoautotrophica]KWX00940.1 hypothetical protein LI90_1968 [Carbonactinospora thermoautotrophica]KWX09497.1 hypothetical protein TR74_09240 [Carbonactinospora thermoautotrophica]